MQRISLITSRFFVKLAFKSKTFKTIKYFGSPNDKNVVPATNDDKKGSIESTEARENQEIESLASVHKVVFDELPEKLMEDYTKSPTVIKFDQHEGTGAIANKKSDQDYLINTEVELNLKDNPLALKVFSEGKLDLADKRIEVKAYNISDGNMLSTEGKNIKEVDLGIVNVLPKNSVYIEDIDPFNIPEDKDILLEKHEKRLRAVGVQVLKNEEKEEGKEQNENRQETNLSKKIFEEVSFDEFKEKNLWFFESRYVNFEFRELIRKMMRYTPLWIFLFFFYHTLFELHAVKKDINLMEEQEMNAFDEIKKRYTAQILTKDPRFDRSKLLLNDQNVV